MFNEERASLIYQDYLSDMTIEEIVDKWDIEYRVDGDGLEELWDIVDLFEEVA
jgi:hypothetical protein